MGRRNRSTQPTLGDALRNSSLLERAVCLTSLCGKIEHEDEAIDLAPYHVHSLGVYLSAANRGPSIHLEFRLHVSEEMNKGSFPCDKLEGALKSFFEGEVDYGGDIGVRKYVTVTADGTETLMPALYSLQRTFRDSEIEHPKKAVQRLEFLERGRTTRMPCVRIAFTDFLRALEGDLEQRFAPDGDDEWVRITQRLELERGTELYVARTPNPSRHRIESDGNVYFKPNYYLEGGAIVRLTAPVVESVKFLVGGLAEDGRLKELVRDLYGT